MDSVSYPLRKWSETESAQRDHGVPPVSVYSMRHAEAAGGWRWHTAASHHEEPRVGNAQGRAGWGFKGQRPWRQRMRTVDGYARSTSDCFCGVSSQRQYVPVVTVHPDKRLGRRSCVISCCSLVWPREADERKISSVVLCVAARSTQHSAWGRPGHKGSLLHSPRAQTNGRPRRSHR